MLRDVLDVLACPHCGAAFSLEAARLVCERGHAFDIARQGYVNLRPGAAGAARGDPREMVEARDRFLDAGHYQPLAEAVVALAGRVLDEGPPGGVADVGAGTGWYLRQVLDRGGDRRGVALEASTYALRRAARAHPRAGAVGCDVWRGIPLRSGACALVLDIFAPRNAPELARILHPDGALIVVTPRPRHLHELVAALDLLTVDRAKEERLDRTLAGVLTRTDRHVHEHRMRLDRAGVAALAGMGPSAWHRAGAQRDERVAALPEPATVTASVTLSVYRRR